MKIFCLLALTCALLNSNIKAQCILGDCTNGFGRMKYTNGQYEGMFLNGKKQGNGKYIWDSGHQYIGAWMNDLITGRGIFYYNGNLTEYYDGDFFKW